MANICNNRLIVFSEDLENIKYIKDFFEDYGGEIEKCDDYNLEIFFDSPWCFPTVEMEKLAKNLPDKDDISMTCLSVEWGCLYCQFHSYDKDGWIAED